VFALVADLALAHDDCQPTLAVVVPDRPSPPATHEYARIARSRGGHHAAASAAGVPDVDSAAYRGRNFVERALCRLKNPRGIATRYDKHARNYRAGLVLAAIVLFWL
jgi:transposase